MEVAVESRGVFRQHHRYVIDDTSKVGEARRTAQALANYEFGQDVAAKVAIAATELATNLLYHANGGELLVQCLDAGDGSVVELLAIDKGSGMTDVARCLTDGYSTRGTSGTGLGAVRRLSNEFDIFSEPGQGTVVMARFGKGSPLRYGAISVAIEGEIDCGDAWHLVHTPEHIALFVIDGLGHGTFAAEAAQSGITAFMASPFSAPADTLNRANAVMSKTRGGAGACAVISGERLSYSGIGNISGYIVNPGRSQGLVSHNGTLGLQQRKAAPFEYERPPGSLLVMHSDGVSARWDLKSRPELMACHPAIVASVIYRDHGRGRDDSTVVVVA
jgi:anti-sigma regulatory factor (Ser/Thr protein kinase)